MKNYEARERARFEKRKARRKIPKEIVNSNMNRRVFGCVDDGFLREMVAAGFKKKGK